MTANLEGLNTLKDMPVTAPETDNKTALVIAAHPDDADFGAAGTSYLWSKEGWTFYYLVCTDGSKGTADPSMKPGDLIRMPMGLPHGIFNKSDRIVKCLFWVAPTRRLYDLFWAIHNMAEQTPAEVVAFRRKEQMARFWGILGRMGRRAFRGKPEPAAGRS